MLRSVIFFLSLAFIASLGATSLNLVMFMSTLDPNNIRLEEAINEVVIDYNNINKNNHNHKEYIELIKKLENIIRTIDVKLNMEPMITNVKEEQNRFKGKPLYLDAFKTTIVLIKFLESVNERNILVKEAATQLLKDINDLQQLSNEDDISEYITGSCIVVCKVFIFSLILNTSSMNLLQVFDVSPVIPTDISKSNFP